MRFGSTHRYSVVNATYSAQNPFWQLSQLGSVAHSRIGTHSPQQLPSTAGTSPGVQLGGGASQSTPLGLHVTVPLAPPAALVALELPALPPLALAAELELVALVAPPLPLVPSDRTSVEQATTKTPKTTTP
jgi:hypothetical protein